MTARPVLLTAAANPWTYLFRALGYLAVSALALVSGAVIALPQAGMNDWLLLVIPLGSSAVFALCYAVSFNREAAAAGRQTAVSDPDVARAAAVTDNHDDLPAQVMLIALSVVIWLETSAIVLLLSHFVFDNPPSATLLLSFATHAALVVGYGLVLFWKFRDRPDPPIRHVLAWPAALFVGTNLYIGLSLNTLHHSLAPLWPLCVLMATFATSEVVTRSSDWRLRLNIFVAGAGLLLVIVSRAFHVDWLRPHADNVSSLIFAIAIAGYLAVFEAWQITGRLAANEFLEDKAGLITECARTSHSRRYYVATLSVLTLTAWIVPAFYTFSERGLWFVALFAIHVLTALWWWTQQAATVQKLRGRSHYEWLFWKLAFSGILLGCVFVDWRFQYPLTDPWLRDNVSAAILTACAVGLGLVVYPRLRDSPGWKSRTLDIAGADRVFSERMNALRVLSGLSYISMLVLFVVQRTILSPDSPTYFKSDPGFMAYLAFVIVALIVEGLNSDRERKNAIKNSIITVVTLLISSTRIVSTSLIGLVLYLGLTTLGLPAAVAAQATLPFVLCALGGFALNDYFDRDRDAIDKPWRPIPARMVSAGAVRRYGIAMLMCAVASWFFSGYSAGETLLFAATLIGVVSYNLVIKHFAAFKVLLTGLMSAAPLWLVLGRTEINPAGFVIAAVLFIAGRELLMDILDANGDKSVGSRTVPLLVGESATSAIGVVFQLCSLIVFSVALYQAGGFPSLLYNPWHVLAVLVTLLLCISWYRLVDRRIQVIRLMWSVLVLDAMAVITVLR